MIRHFHSLILRNMLGPLVAAIQLFLLYVVVHGHYSPGGAFQGGTLLACCLLLPILSGRIKGFLVISSRAAISMSAIGVLIFAGTGIVPMLLGGPLLDHGALPFGSLEPSARQSLGILMVEAGVTLAVAGALVSICYSLDREPSRDTHRDAGRPHRGSKGEGS
ncbi:MAG: MnhB domain-containing protein [Vicinamibacterales bacterium]|nr:MnhB domain-containing protein [Vicinamibacterales bacterium]